MKITDHVDEHSADKIFAYIIKINRVDRFKPFEGFVSQNEMRSRFLEQYPDGLISDFITWVVKHAEDSENYGAVAT